MRADDTNNRPRPLPRPTNPPDGPPKPAPSSFDAPAHLSWAGRMVQISIARQGLTLDDLEVPAHATRAEADMARAA